MEKLYRKNLIILFGLIIINRIMVSSIEWTQFLYQYFDPTTTYYFMIDVFEFNRVYYVIAAHISFLYLAFKNKEPNFFMVIVSSILIYLLASMNPEINELVFYGLYGFGIISFLVGAYYLYYNLYVFEYKAIGLMAIYFIYSALLLLKHINQVGDLKLDFNMSYAYPLVLSLSVLILYGKRILMEFLISRKSVIGLIVISMILAGIQFDKQIIVMQHIVFVVTMIFFIKVINDIREATRDKFKSQFLDKNS